ncbi:MAG: hypothetical protein FWH29_00050 [Methanobrevibacter sp.]|nr:hypothetical protein [Methanobrevibacter sp.]
MPNNVFTGSLIFSHILPIILGFIGVLLMTTGIMDDDNYYTKVGVALFIIAALMPFLVLSIVL